MSGSLLLCKDVANSKLRELEVDSNGLLKVDKVDVSALATESSVSTLSAKITACDTGAVAVSSSALPSGAATSVIQTLGNTILSTLDGKVTAVDTGAVVVSSSALPSGASSSAYQSVQISELQTHSTSLSNIDSEVQSQSTHLSDIASCVSAGVMTTSGSSDLSATSSWVYGGAASTSTIADAVSLVSSGFDADNYAKVTIAGNTTNTSDSSIDIQVSNDNAVWFELSGEYLNIDWSSGDFGASIDVCGRYIRLKRSNTSGSSESIKAWISGKK